MVVKQKRFKVLAESYNINDPYGPFKTAAESAYIRDAVQGQVPFYVILQAQKKRGESTEPNGLSIETHVFAAMANGAAGIGFWTFDMDSEKDIYTTDRKRWGNLFQLIERGRRFAGFERGKPDVYVLKPRYAAYGGERDVESSLDVFAQLARQGFSAGFILEEQAYRDMVPGDGEVVYVPPSYVDERPEALHALSARGVKTCRHSLVESFVSECIPPHVVHGLCAGAEPGSGVHVLHATQSILLHNTQQKASYADVSLLGGCLRVSLSAGSLVVIDSPPRE